MATDLIGHDIDIRIIRSVITQYQFIVSPFLPVLPKSALLTGHVLKSHKDFFDTRSPTRYHLIVLVLVRNSPNETVSKCKSISLS